MIRVFKQDYREGDIAVRETVVLFLCIPIYRSRVTTAKTKAVGMYSNNDKSIKGFV